MRKEYIPAGSRRFESFLAQESGMFSYHEDAPRNRVPKELPEGTHTSLPCCGQDDVFGCLVTPAHLVLMASWPDLRKLGMTAAIMPTIPSLPLCDHCSMLFYTRFWGYRCKTHWISSVAMVEHLSAATVRARYERAISAVEEVTKYERTLADEVVGRVVVDTREIHWHIGDPTPLELQQLDQSYVLSYVDFTLASEGSFLFRFRHI